MRGPVRATSVKLPANPLLSGPSLGGQWDPESPRGTALYRTCCAFPPSSTFCPCSQASLSPPHTEANRLRGHVPQPVPVCAGRRTWVPPQQASWAQPPGPPASPSLNRCLVLDLDPDTRETKVKASAEPARTSSPWVPGPEGL